MTPQDAIPVAVEGRIKIPYRWPAGKLGSHFLAALRDEKQILGLRCPDCEITHVPPRLACLECGRTPSQWVPVGPEGELRGWTVRDGVAFALVQLDNRIEEATTILTHRLIEVDQAKLTHGARVTAVFAEARTGAITDIVGFRLL